MRVGGDDLHQPQRRLAHLLDVGPGETVLDRPADGRPEVERVDEHVGADERFAPELLELRHQAVARLERGRHHDHLTEEGVLQLLVERQIEADRALADVGAPVGNGGIAFEARLERVHLLARLLDRGRLRQGQIDQDLDAVGRREELLLHERHSDHRGGK